MKRVRQTIILILSMGMIIAYFQNCGYPVNLEPDKATIQMSSTLTVPEEGADVEVRIRMYERKFGLPEKFEYEITPSNIGLPPDFQKDGEDAHVGEIIVEGLESIEQMVEEGFVLKIPSYDDNLYEGNSEEFTLTLTDPTGNFLPEPLVQKFYLGENDPKPAIDVIALGVAPENIDLEGYVNNSGIEGDTFFFEARLTHPSAFPIDFEMSEFRGTAVINLDYLPSDYNFTFAAEEMVVPFSIATINEDPELYEPVAETVIFEIMTSSDATIGAGSGAFTFGEDSAPPSIGTGLGQTLSAIEGNDLVFTLDFGVAIAGGFTVDYRIAQADGNFEDVDSAETVGDSPTRQLKPTDFDTAMTGSVDVIDGDSQVSIRIPTFDDDANPIAEGSEDFRLDVTLPAFFDAVAIIPEFRGTIQDNDPVSVYIVSEGAPDSVGDLLPGAHMVTAIPEPASNFNQDVKIITSIPIGPSLNVQVSTLVLPDINGDDLVDGSLSVPGGPFFVATEGSDFQGISNQVVSLPGGDVIGVNTFSTRIFPDNEYESDHNDYEEAYAVVLSNLSDVVTGSPLDSSLNYEMQAHDSGSGYGAHYIQIIDNDLPDVEFELTGIIPVDEGIGNAVVNVRTVGGNTSSSPIQVTLSTSDGSGGDAARDTGGGDRDYTGGTYIATIMPGDTMGSISIPINDDLLDEVDEEFDVNFVAISNGIFVGPTSVEIRIDDNEVTPQLEIAGNVTVSEADGIATIVVQTVGGSLSSRDIPFRITTSNGTAIAGQDFSSINIVRNITSGNNFRSIDINIIDTLNGSSIPVYELTESFNVTLTEVDGALGQIGVNDSAIVNITDDEAQPEIKIVSPISVTEGAGDSLTVEIDNGVVSQADFSFTASTSDVTAVENDDYTKIDEATYMVTGLTSSTIIPVDALTDKILEGSETYNVAVTGTGLGTYDSSPVSITINDNSATPEIEIVEINGEDASSGNVNISESAGSGIVVKVKTIGGATSTSPITFSAQANALTAGLVDYNIDNVAVHTIAANSEETTFTLDILEDTIYEQGNEVFEIELFDNSANVNLASGASRNATIIDNEAPPVIELASSSLSVNEDAGTASLTVQITGPTTSSSSPINFSFNTIDGTATGGGDDFTSVTGAGGVIGAGAASTSIGVSLNVENNYYEADETFQVQLNSSVTGGSLGGQSTATVTINNDEDPPQIAIDSVASGNEGNTIGIAVSIVDPIVTSSQLPITFDVNAIDGSATGGGVDYTLNGGAGSRSIPANVSSMNISLDLASDAIYESNENFSVVISNPLVGGEVPNISNSTGTITINDPSPQPNISVVGSTAGDENGDVAVVVNVEIEGGRTSDSPIEFRYITRTVSGDRAASSTDFSLLSVGDDQRGTIAAGATGTSISIPISPDSIYEETEFFEVQLESVTSGNANINVGTLQVSILDDDPKPTFAVLPPLGQSFNSISESGTSHSFRVQKNGAFDPDFNFTVTMGSSNVSTSGSDYSLGSSTVTFTGASGSIENFSISIPVDSVIEDDEIFNLDLLSTSDGTGNNRGGIWAQPGAITEIPITIKDATVLEMKIEASNSVVFEGNNTQIRIFPDNGITLSNGSVKCQVTVTDGDATSVIDFNFSGSNSNIIGAERNIPNGTSAGSPFTFNFNALNDIIVDRNYNSDQREDLSLAMSCTKGPSAVPVVNSPLVINIQDEDVNLEPIVVNPEEGHPSNPNAKLVLFSGTTMAADVSGNIVIQLKDESNNDLITEEDLNFEMKLKDHTQSTKFIDQGNNPVDISGSPSFTLDDNLFTDQGGRQEEVNLPLTMLGGTGTVNWEVTYNQLSECDNEDRENRSRKYKVYFNGSSLSGYHSVAFVDQRSAPLVSCDD